MRALLLTFVLSLMITVLLLAFSLLVGFMFYLFESVWVVAITVFICLLPFSYILVVKIQNMD